MDGLRREDGRRPEGDRVRLVARMVIIVDAGIDLQIQNDGPVDCACLCLCDITRELDRSETPESNENFRARYACGKLARPAGRVNGFLGELRDRRDAAKLPHIARPLVNLLVIASELRL